MKHINVPVFVPHLGCPHTCVFCNQHTITGQSEFPASLPEQALEEAVSRISNRHDGIQIAFFGGSFTAIEPSLMTALLEKAESYVKKGLVSSIRLSTRPDAISERILTQLSRYSVRTIELGIQSTDNLVLLASERGHTAEDSERACRLVKKFGFELVGQMMVGLPASTRQSDEQTARDIVSWSADAARIYPTVIFRDTTLDVMQQTNRYRGLSLEEAVAVSASVYRIFCESGVEVIRIGLCETEGLRKNTVAGGAYHPALGELVLNEFYKQKICSALEGKKIPRSAELCIEVAPKALSKAVGQKKSNLVFLKNRYPENRIRFSPSVCVAENEVKIIVKENGFHASFVS